MKIFISHIHEEAKLAGCLKEWIENVTSGQCDVFASSDSENISAGDKWLDKVDNTLNESDLLLILYSKHSMTKPWINFEAGCACAWMKSDLVK